MPGHVAVNVHGVLTLTLAGPQKKNALTSRVHAALPDTPATAEAGSTIRAVLHPRRRRQLVRRPGERHRDRRQHVTRLAYALARGHQGPPCMEAR